MLVLTRKLQERIVLQEIGVEIVICEIRSDRVRIGVEAPDSITVLRKELEDQNADRGHEEATGGPGATGVGASPPASRLPGRAGACDRIDFAGESYVS